MSLPSLCDTKWAPGTDLLTFTFESPYQVDELKPIYIDAEAPARNLNKSQTRTLVRKLIAGFQAQGLKQGDCILVVLANNVLYSALHFGVIGAGGVFQGANPRSSALEFDHIMRLTQPEFIITSLDILPTLQKAAACRGYLQERFYLLNIETFPFPHRGTCLPAPLSDDHAARLNRNVNLPRSLTDLLSYGESDWIRFSNVTLAKSTPAAMLSTSGTSGLPKAAVLSHFALVSQHLSTTSDALYPVRRLISLPFFHIIAALFLHIYPLRFGQPVFIMRRFQSEAFIHLIRKFDATDTYMVPPMVNSILQSSLPLVDELKSLRFIAVGGAPIGTDMMRNLEAKLHPSATFTQIWGLTEVGAVTFSKYPERDGCDGSIGRLLPGYRMRLLDGSGKVITEDNDSGEVQVRYEGMMTGYKNHPPFPVGEWYSTGDVMTRVNGKYFVVGRIKELIKVNGFQVAPAEIEAILLTHPCISDAAVIGIMHQTRPTEVPRAYIVRRDDPDRRCDREFAEDVYQFARKTLASYKALEGGIVQVESIPRTASGKIQRFKIVEMEKYHAALVKRYTPFRANDVAGA